VQAVVEKTAKFRVEFCPVAKLDKFTPKLWAKFGKGRCHDLQLVTQCPYGSGVKNGKP